MLIIGLVFAIICFYSCFDCLSNVKLIASYHPVKHGQILGPLNIGKNPKIYQLEAYFYGNDSSVDFSAEILDSEKDTLYEVGRDLWHESGYDSEGYWTESIRRMVARLNFHKPGKYYIRLENPTNNQDFEVIIKKVKSSYVPYFMMGFWLLILSIIFGIINNKDTVKVLIQKINESVEED